MGTNGGGSIVDDIRGAPTVLNSIRAMSASSGQPRYPIDSVGNALSVLTQLRSHSPLRTADVAERLGISRSTAHRLLSSLQAHEFLEQDDASQGYVMGSALRRLGAAAVSRIKLRQTAHHALLELARSTGETCGLVILDQGSTLLVDVIEGTHPLRVVLGVGSRTSADSAAGKAILAGGLPSQSPSPTTENSGELPTIGPSQQEVANIREVGYAVTSPSTDSSYLTIAAAIQVPRGETGAAVSMALPAIRADDRAVQTLGSRVAATAREVEELLAENSPSAGSSSES